MFKALLILAIILYLLSKVGNMFYRAGAASQQRRNSPPPPPDTNIKTDKRPGSIKGGEYVDYEEVK